MFILKGRVSGNIRKVVAVLVAQAFLFSEFALAQTSRPASDTISAYSASQLVDPKRSDAEDLATGVTPVKGRTAKDRSKGIKDEAHRRSVSGLVVKAASLARQANRALSPADVRGYVDSQFAAGCRRFGMPDSVAAERRAFVASLPDTFFTIPGLNPRDTALVKKQDAVRNSASGSAVYVAAARLTYRYIGISMGGNKLAISLNDGNNNIVGEHFELRWKNDDRFKDDKVKKKTPQMVEMVMDLLEKEIVELLERNEVDFSKIKVLSASLAGPLNEKTGIFGDKFPTPNLPFYKYNFRAGLMRRLRNHGINLDILEMFNDAKARHKGETYSPQGQLRIHEGPGSIVICGGGINIYPARAGENGHNIFQFRSKDGNIHYRWAGSRSRGKHPIEVGNKAREIKKKSGRMGEEFVRLGIRGFRKKYPRYPLIEWKKGMRDFEDRLSGPSIRARVALEVARSKGVDEGYARLAKTAASLKGYEGEYERALTPEALDGNNMAIYWIKAIGDEMGRALAAFIAAHKDKPYARRIVLVSGVNENLGLGVYDNMEDEKAGLDIYIKNVRAAVKGELVTYYGMNPKRAEEFASGIVRSNMDYRGELTAHQPTDDEVLTTYDNPAGRASPNGIPEEDSRVKAIRLRLQNMKDTAEEFQVDEGFGEDVVREVTDAGLRLVSAVNGLIIYHATTLIQEINTKTDTWKALRAAISDLRKHAATIGIQDAVSSFESAAALIESEAAEVTQEIADAERGQRTSASGDRTLERCATILEKAEPEIKGAATELLADKDLYALFRYLEVSEDGHVVTVALENPDVPNDLRGFVIQKKTEAQKKDLDLAKMPDYRVRTFWGHTFADEATMVEPSGLKDGAQEALARVKKESWWTNWLAALPRRDQRRAALKREEGRLRTLRSAVALPESRSELIKGADKELASAAEAILAEADVQLMLHSVEVSKDGHVVTIAIVNPDVSSDIRGFVVQKKTAAQKEEKDLAAMPDYRVRTFWGHTFADVATAKEASGLAAMAKAAVAREKAKELWWNPWVDSARKKQAASAANRRNSPSGQGAIEVSAAVANLRAASNQLYLQLEALRATKAIDTSKMAIIINEGLSASAPGNPHGNREMLLQEYRVMEQNLKKLLGCEEDIVRVNDAAKLKEALVALRQKERQVIVLDNGTLSKGLTPEGIKGVEGRDYCVVNAAMENVDDPKLEARYLDLYALALLGVGKLRMAQTNNADDALFRWAYQAVNGKSPTDAEMDQAGSNWIITIVPQAIRFNTNEQNMKKELRELISASA